MPNKTAKITARESHAASDRIIVVGASAGGIEAIRTLVRELPPDLPAAMCVVIHIPASSPNMLPQIFSKDSCLRVVPHFSNGEIPKPGHMYVAPPDWHLLLDSGRLLLTRGPTENRHRPAIDPLFRSAARAYGPNVIGVLLTGNLDDGTAGMRVIKRFGGTTVVQDPRDAPFPDMPRNALNNVRIDYTVPLMQMPDLLADLAKNHHLPGKALKRSRRAGFETEVVEMKRPLDQMNEFGKPSAQTCPHCHGVLWEVRDGKMVRFRCRVGHAFSAENLEAAQTEQLETALWSAVRALEEKASLMRGLANQARQGKHVLTARYFEKRAKELVPPVKILRGILLDGEY